MSKLKSLLTALATISTVGTVAGQLAGSLDPHTAGYILTGAAIAGIAGHSITDVLAAMRGAQPSSAPAAQDGPQQ